MRHNIAGSKRGVFPLLLKICVLIGLRTGYRKDLLGFSLTSPDRQTGVGQDVSLSVSQCLSDILVPSEW